MPHPRKVYTCTQCGSESPKWLGRCPGCNEWNTYVESAPVRKETRRHPVSGVQELSRVTNNVLPRLRLPLSEFNRVLGGGLVPGSVVLMGGDPGIGKSTLLLQVAGPIAAGEGNVLYVSGEESVHQIKLRAERLGMPGERLFLLPETELETILEHAEGANPRLVIVDSIQTVYIGELGPAAGSVAQVRECTSRLMRWAKRSNVPVFIVGHVTKDGVIAGPHTLEHIVDVVLYLEGERFSTYRLLRGVKNRFGSINEVGVFEMSDAGMVEVENPSEIFLSQRARHATGSVIVPIVEGTRPLLVEVQALASPTPFGMPRRNSNGVDYNRLLMIAAVLSKRAGIPLGSQDIIVNVAGGIRVNEPAADLGIALAIASSYRNAEVRSGLVALGEIGLGGELRSVSHLEKRLAEAAKLGFKTCLLPPVKAGARIPPDIEILPVVSLAQALRKGLEREGDSGSD
ncbi:MAG: DNA repair protein RadA [Dehalococcoidia bacterium]|nr:DNA repair protein RadA [Dehalococcoidia bacterium]